MYKLTYTAGTTIVSTRKGMMCMHIIFKIVCTLYQVQIIMSFKIPYGSDMRLEIKK